MLSGREFNDADVLSTAPVAIVNQLFASTYWPGEDPLGKRFRFFDGDTAEPWRTVVGVASNIIQNDQTRQTFDPVVYLPYRQKPGGGAWIFVRTAYPSGWPHHCVSGGGPGVGSRPAFVWAHGDQGTHGKVLGQPVLWISIPDFAAIALLLASIGLYTVIAQSMSQRTQEIGVRMAIGGTPRDILKLVFRQGMLPLAIGWPSGWQPRSRSTAS